MNNNEILLSNNFASKIRSTTRTLIDWKIAVQIKPKIFDVVK